MDYGPHARRFLLRAKTGRRPELLRPMGAQLAAAVIVAGLASGIDAIIPVPSSLTALWRRGFNPAGVLAAEVARRVGRPRLTGVLRRRGLHEGSLKKLGSQARWAGIAGRLAARPIQGGMRILLVDDVLTTGATATACTLALLKAGALEVRVAVWARTPLPGAAFFDRKEGTSV